MPGRKVKLHCDRAEESPVSVKREAVIELRLDRHARVSRMARRRESRRRPAPIWTLELRRLRRTLSGKASNKGRAGNNSATGASSWRALGVSRAGQTTTDAPATLADADTRTADAEGSRGATQLELAV